MSHGEGFGDYLAEVGGPEFAEAEDVGYVRHDEAVTDEERGDDHFVGLALRQERQHVAFARGEIDERDPLGE